MRLSISITRCLNVDSVRCHQIKLFHPMSFVSDREFSNGCARAVKRLLVVLEENGGTNREKTLRPQLFFNVLLWSPIVPGASLSCLRASLD